MHTQPAVDHPVHAAPSALAPLGALVAVMLLSGMTIAFDLVLDHSSDRRDAELESSVKATAVIADLRTQLDHWASPLTTRNQRLVIATQIEDDVRAFDPIATRTSAREEWSQLALVAHRLLETEPSTAPVVLEAAGRALDRLAAGSQRGAAARAAGARESDHRRSLARALVGLVTLVLSATVAIMVAQRGRRERRASDR